METSSEKVSTRFALGFTRRFESSRRDDDNLAVAFERALPTIRRAAAAGPDPRLDRRRPGDVRRIVS